MKRIFTLLFVLALSKSYSQTDYSFVYQNDSIIQHGIALHDAEKYDDAIKEYDRIAITDPKYLNAQYEKSLSLAAAEKKDELRLLFEKMRPKMSQYPMLYISYGVFLSDEEEFDASQKIFQEGEKYLSNSSSFYYNLGILQIRKNERQKSVESFEKAIFINPNSASSHYFLGLLAMEDGQISQGTIALMSYLVLSPTGQYAESSVLQMNNKYGENFLAKPTLKLSASGDDFSELDEILRNQLSLKSAYKIKSDIDEVVIRQMQAVAEYASSHKIGNGFFETTYLPWIKAMYDQNHFEGFSYYSLLSLEEKLGKKLTSQKKKITNFTENFITTGFWPLFAKRQMDIFGEKKDIIVYLKNSSPYYMGEIRDGKHEGKFKVVNVSGNITAEVNYKNNELQGLQKYYDDEGNLVEEKTFENGIVNGVRKTFYTNGNIDMVENYKNGKLDGVSTTYHVNGGKNCTLNYNDGNAEGALICTYPNGNKKSNVNYKNNKLDGQVTYYNEAGDITSNSEYKEGELNGKSTSYFDGKNIKSDGEFAMGKVKENYKSLFSNGTTESESFYANGKINKRIAYYQNGMKSVETFYDSDENVERYISYDASGNKYFEEKIKNGELKSGLQYGSKFTKPVEVSPAKKSYTVFNYEGKLRTDGFFDKGKKTGEWKYRYSSGLIRLKENYVNGKQDGIATTYTRSGALHQIQNYKNDMLNGRTENYDYGKISNITNYIDDVEHGPYQYFHPNGSVSTEGFIFKNQVVGVKNSYWYNATLLNRSTYIENQNTKTEYFNLDGKLQHTQDYKNLNGSVVIKLNSGALIETSDFTNGFRNGKYLKTDQFGKSIADLNFVNGLRHGAFKFYSPNGTLSSVGNYYCGNLHGTDTSYDLVGNLRNETQYIFGDNTGKSTRYYYNKNKMLEYSELDGGKEGEFKYFNLNGEVVLVVNYINNAPMSYQILAKDGTLATPIAIVDENATIISNYPNNQAAIKMQFKGGNWDGKLIIQNPDGKIATESNYKDGILEGERSEFYASGKIFKKEQFSNGDFNGKVAYFKEDGKPWIAATYNFDELHGDFLIYTNGTLSATKKYDSDELIATIK